MAHNYNQAQQGMNWQNYPQQQHEPQMQEPSYYTNPNEINQSGEDFFPTIDLTQVYDPAVPEIESESQITKRIMILDELIRTYSVDNNLTSQVDFSNIQPPNMQMNHQQQYKMKRPRRCQPSTATSTDVNMNMPTTSYHPYRQAINNINIQTQNFNLPMKPQPMNYPYYANEVNNYKPTRKQRSNVRITEIPPPNWNGAGFQQAALPAIDPNKRITEIFPEAVSTAQSQLNLINRCNIAALNQIGQETLIEVVKHSEEMFYTFKNANRSQINCDEMNSKLQNSLRYLLALFKRLELVSSKCCDSSKMLDLGKLDGDLLNRLLNYKENPNLNVNSNIKQEDLNVGFEARQRLQEEALMKNTELKQVIDKLRLIIWECNMLKKEPGTQ